PAYASQATTVSSAPTGFKPPVNTPITATTASHIQPRRTLQMLPNHFALTISQLVSGDVSSSSSVLRLRSPLTLADARTATAKRSRVPTTALIPRTQALILSEYSSQGSW